MVQIYNVIMKIVIIVKIILAKIAAIIGVIQAVTISSNNTVKSVQIVSFFWSVFSRIQSKYGKYGPEKTSYLDTFHAV